MNKLRLVPVQAESDAAAAAWALDEWLRRGGEETQAARKNNGGGIWAAKRVRAPPLSEYQWSLVC